MKRFAYALDPLCLVACALYAFNRFWLQEHSAGAFLHGYFNDLLLIPAALPLLLWLQRRLGLRLDDARPRWSEILLHVFAWSFVAELIVPHFLAHTTSDARDVLAYTAGAIVSGCWWHLGPASS